MKAYFYNNGYFKGENHYDFADGKYLMEKAQELRDVLANCPDDVPTLMNCWRTLIELRKYYSPKDPYDRFHTDYDLTVDGHIGPGDIEKYQKGYHIYCRVIDVILADLAAAITFSNTAMNEEEGWMTNLLHRASKKVFDALYLRNGIDSLANGVITLEMDGKYRDFHYVYTTCDYLPYDGKMFYTKDFDSIEDLKKAIKEKLIFN